MKKCPFCAEEIQKNAKYCRYCFKKVTGLWFKKTIFIIVVLLAAAGVYRIRGEAGELKNSISVAKNEVIKFLNDLKRGRDMLGDYTRSFKEHREGMR